MGKTGYTAKAKKAYKRTGAYKKKPLLWSSEILSIRWNTSQEGLRSLRLYRPALEFDRHLQRILFFNPRNTSHRKARCSLGLRLPIFASTFLICWSLLMWSIPMVCFAIGTIRITRLCARCIRSLPTRPLMSLLTLLWIPGQWIQPYLLFNRSR